MPQYEVGDETMFFLNDTRYEEYINGGSGGGVSMSDVNDAIAAHAADTTAVHGISDTQYIKGAYVNVDGGASFRPDFVSVDFVTLNDPASVSEDGDTWPPTGS